MTEFGNRRGDLAGACAELRVAEAALSFVARGLRDETGRSTVTPLNVFKALVTARLTETALFGGLYGSATLPKQSQAASDKTWRDAHLAFLTAYKSTADLFFPKLPAPYLGGFADPADECALSKEVTGIEPLDVPREPDAGTNMLQHAYEMACFNMARYEQRIVVLFVLGNVVRGRQSVIPVPACEEEFENARQLLWQRHMTHQAKRLALSILLGGAALEDSRRLVKENWGPGMSVMELLEPDGSLTGRWQSETEEALRQAIEQA